LLFTAVLIVIWVAGITVQEIQKVLKHGMDRYLSEWWHLALIPMIVFYIIAIVLWCVGYAFAVSNSGDWTVYVRGLVGNAPVGSYNLLLLSNSFYSLALMLTFFEASHFLQVNSTLGPLHLSLMMMVKDIVRFLALFGLNVLAFALAMRRLYSHPVQNSDHTSEETKGTHNHSFQRLALRITSYKQKRIHLIFYLMKDGLACQNIVLKLTFTPLCGSCSSLLTTTTKWSKC